MNQAGPMSFPTWYQWADGGYYIIPRARSAWAKYMAERRSCLYLHRLASATLPQGPDQGRRRAGRGAKRRRALGRNRHRDVPPLPRRKRPKYLEPTLDEPRWLFFVKPKKVYSWEGANWARRYKHANGERKRPGHTHPDAIERILPWGAVLRGFRWGKDLTSQSCFMTQAPTSMPGQSCQSRSRVSSRSRRSPSTSPGMVSPTIPGSQSGCPISCESLLDLARLPDAGSSSRRATRRSPHSSRPRCSSYQVWSASRRGSR